MNCGGAGAFPQASYDALAASDFFYDGKAMRQPIAGTLFLTHGEPVPGGERCRSSVVRLAPSGLSERRFHPP